MTRLFPSFWLYIRLSASLFPNHWVSDLSGLCLSNHMVRAISSADSSVSFFSVERGLSVKSLRFNWLRAYFYYVCLFLVRIIAEIDYRVSFSCSKRDLSMRTTTFGRFTDLTARVLSEFGCICLCKWIHCKNKCGYRETFKLPVRERTFCEKVPFSRSSDVVAGVC